MQESTSSHPLNFQELFLSLLKDKTPPHLSLVDELSDLLNVSNDSAYRRLRGETALSINEAYILAEHFGISLDSLLQLSGNAVAFESINFIDHNFNSDSYLGRILKDMQQIASFEEKEIIYAAKDIPIFHLFLIPEIAAFKAFFWTKTIASLPDLEAVKFSVNRIDEKTMELCRKILKEYLEIPSVEIWSDETITSLLRQIEYYHDCGLFENEQDAVALYQKIEQLLEHLELQTKTGVKFAFGSSPQGGKNFKMYWNEVVLPENTILSVTNGHITTHLSHDVMDYLVTQNERFSNMTMQTIGNVIKRSVLISEVSEKSRNTFFRKLRKKLEQLKSKIEH